MMMHGVHALLDQEYSGDINIVPQFRFQNPLNLISQPSEQELRLLVREGERATYSRIESVRRCTQISRTLEEILHRFEYGDLRPAPGDRGPATGDRHTSEEQVLHFRVLHSGKRTRCRAYHSTLRTARDRQRTDHTTQQPDCRLALRS